MHLGDRHGTQQDAREPERDALELQQSVAPARAQREVEHLQQERGDDRGRRQLCRRPKQGDVDGPHVRGPRPDGQRQVNLRTEPGEEARDREDEERHAVARAVRVAAEQDADADERGVRKPDDGEERGERG